MLRHLRKSAGLFKISTDTLSENESIKKYKIDLIDSYWFKNVVT